MKIVVFGLGYVGAIAAACLLKDGHSVVGIDASPEKAAKIEARLSPVSEPGVEELSSVGRDDGRLLADPDRLAALGDAARRYILVHWTWEAHFLTLESAMFDALKDSAPTENALSNGNGE